jgi:mannan endo-1,4-beta-mannosidase
MIKHFISFVFALLISCAGMAQTGFVKVNKGGQFTINSKVYYYAGTNFWYGPILGSKGQGGNRVRLIKELDRLHALGLDNLRILVGGDGKNEFISKIKPTLQTEPGVYNDTILDGLDYMLLQMKKRNMKAVLYLNNAWEWTGGYSQYLAWVKHDQAPIPAKDGWPAYMNYVKQYVFNDSAKALFANHVKFILSRTNRYTHTKYINDPTIMAWQISNEPRAFSEEGKVPFRAWLRDVSALIKSIDKNHLVTTGSEGQWGCENDMQLCKDIHADPNIDYICMHLWPYNWSWISKTTLQSNLGIAQKNTKDYVDRHVVLARQLHKPVVMEEYGYPRDGFSFSKKSTTTARDKYYQFVYNLLVQSKKQHDNFAGCNFWGWGGFANPKHVSWQWGDDYCADPSQEEQGLNSVFASDASTIKVIRDAVRKLK